jgi:hypothetical protein
MKRYFLFLSLLVDQYANGLRNCQLRIKDAFLPFIRDWRYGVWAILALGLGVPLASNGNFLPQIVARLVGTLM